MKNKTITIAAVQTELYEFKIDYEDEEMFTKWYHQLQNHVKDIVEWGDIFQFMEEHDLVCTPSLHVDNEPQFSCLGIVEGENDNDK